MKSSRMNPYWILSSLCIWMAFWLFSIADKPGDQTWAAIAFGVSAGATISFIRAGVRAEIAERSERVSR